MAYDKVPRSPTKMFEAKCQVHVAYIRVIKNMYDKIKIREKEHF